MQALAAQVIKVSVMLESAFEVAPAVSYIMDHFLIRTFIMGAYMQGVC